MKYTISIEQTGVDYPLVCSHIPGSLIPRLSPPSDLIASSMQIERGMNVR